MLLRAWAPTFINYIQIHLFYQIFLFLPQVRGGRLRDEYTQLCNIHVIYIILFPTVTCHILVRKFLVMVDKTLYTQSPSIRFLQTISPFLLSTHSSYQKGSLIVSEYWKEGEDSSFWMLFFIINESLTSGFFQAQRNLSRAREQTKELWIPDLRPSHGMPSQLDLGWLGPRWVFQLEITIDILILF